MFCHKCGNQTLDEAVFCPKCGEKLINDKTEQTATTGFETTDTNTEKSEPLQTESMDESSTKDINNDEAYKLLKQVTVNAVKIEEIQFDSKGIVLKGKYNKYIVNIVNGQVIVRIGARLWLAILWGLTWIAMLFTASSQKGERDTVVRIICDTLGANPEKIYKAERKRILMFLLIFLGILFVIPGLLSLIVSYLFIDGFFMAIGFSITIAGVFMIIMGLINRNKYKVKYENVAAPSSKERKKWLFILSASGILSVVFIIFSTLWINGVFDNNDYDDYYSSAVYNENISLSKTYTNDEEGFSFDYTRDFYIYEGEEIYDEIQFYDDESSQDKIVYLCTFNIGGKILSSIEVSKPIDVDIKAVFSATKSDFQREYSSGTDDLHIIELSDIFLDGTPVRKLTFSYIQNEDVVFLTKYFYGINQDVYVVTYFAFEYNFNEYEPIYNAIMDSYTITSPILTDNSIDSNINDIEEDSTVTENLYPGEMLYNDIPIYWFFVGTINDVADVFGIDIDYNEAKGFSDDIEFYLNDTGGVTSFYSFNPGAFEINGVTLDKNRDGLIDLLDNPIGEGLSVTDDLQIYGYNMRYEQSNYLITFEMDSRDDEVHSISIFLLSAEINDDTPVTESIYSGEVLYNGIPISSLLDFNIEDVKDDWKDSLVYEDSGYSRFGAIGLSYYEITGIIYKIDIHSSSWVELDGITLDKMDRNDLIKSLGSPTREYSEEYENEYDGKYTVNYILYEYSDFNIIFLPNNYDNKVSTIEIWKVSSSSKSPNFSSVEDGNNNNYQEEGIFKLYETTPIKTANGNIYKASFDMIASTMVSYVNITNPSKIYYGCKIQILSNKNMWGNYETYKIDEDGNSGGTVYYVVDAKVIE